MSEYAAVVAVYSGGEHLAFLVQPPITDPELVEILNNAAANPYKWAPRYEMEHEATEFQFPVRKTDDIHSLATIIIVRAHAAFTSQGHSLKSSASVVDRVNVEGALALLHLQK